MLRARSRMVWGAGISAISISFRISQWIVGVLTIGGLVKTPDDILSTLAPSRLSPWRPSRSSSLSTDTMVWTIVSRDPSCENMETAAAIHSPSVPDCEGSVLVFVAGASSCVSSCWSMASSGWAPGSDMAYIFGNAPWVGCRMREWLERER